LTVSFEAQKVRALGFVDILHAERQQNLKHGGNNKQDPHLNEGAECSGQPM
jgi:hypothetical protein